MCSMQCQTCAPAWTCVRTKSEDTRAGKLQAYGIHGDKRVHASTILIKRVGFSLPRQGLVLVKNGCLPACLPADMQ